MALDPTFFRLTRVSFRSSKSYRVARNEEVETKLAQLSKAIGNGEDHETTFLYALDIAHGFQMMCDLDGPQAFLIRHGKKGPKQMQIQSASVETPSVFSVYNTPERNMEDVDVFNAGLNLLDQVKDYHDPAQGFTLLRGKDSLTFLSPSFVQDQGTDFQVTLIPNEDPPSPEESKYQAALEAQQAQRNGVEQPSAPKPQERPKLSLAFENPSFGK